MNWIYFMVYDNSENDWLCVFRHKIELYQIGFPFHRKFFKQEKKKKEGTETEGLPINSNKEFIVPPVVISDQEE